MTELVSKSSNPLHQAEYVEINLKSVLNLIKNSYKLMVIIITIFFVASLYYAETRPPTYESEAMIQVGNNDLGGAISSGGGNTSAIENLSGLASQSSSADVEVVLIKSPYTLGQVVRQMGFDISVSPYYKGFFARKWAELRHIESGNVSVSTLNVPDDLLSKPLILTVHNENRYSLSTKNGKKILDGTVGKVKIATYFSQPLKIKVVALNAKSGRQFELVKQQIADVANGIAGRLSIREAGIGTGIMNMRYVSKNREQAQVLLNAILTAAVKGNIKEKAQEAAKTLQFISTQLPISKNLLENAENSFNQYSVKTGIFNPVSASEMLIENMTTLHNTLEQLQFDKMLLLQKFTPIHPLVIAETQKEDQVKSRIEKIKKKLTQLPPIEEKEINMQRDAKIKASIYTALVEGAQRMEMTKASMISSVRILSPATYPVSRIPVDKQKIVFSGIIFGLIFSLAIIFIRHLLSPVIEDPDLIERALGVAVVSIIPYSEKQMRYNKKVKHNKLYANTKSFLLARENPHEPSIENMRSLRTSIQMSLLNAKNNVIALTGCSPSVGKSFISSNLALLFSDLNKRILIIDSDMRLGKLSQCFGKAKLPGLSTYLQNEANLEQIIQNIIPDKLDFIATGLYPENPAELLVTDAFKYLIETLKDSYDLVIIDTPPILAVTDPALILRNSATNIMVLGVGKNHTREALHAKKILEKNGVTLFGIVFNTLTRQKQGFGMNYDYGYYSYKAEYGENTKEI